MNAFLLDCEKRARDLGCPSTASILVVSIADQKLFVLPGTLARVYPVSTSRYGTGQQTGSLKTPLGWHRVAARYGDGQPKGMIFRDRKPTGHLCPRGDWDAPSAPDYILSRLLHLEGLEPGLNCGGDVDSFTRYIYLHGTNHEKRLGEPASQGCIRMGNDDVIALFDTLAAYDEVWCWIG